MTAAAGITDEQRVRIAEMLEHLVSAQQAGDLPPAAVTLAIGTVLHTAAVMSGLSIEDLERSLLPLTRARLAS